MRLTARRVRRLRARIAATRCPLWPGITHLWEEYEAPVLATYGLGITGRRCGKCGVPEA